MKKDKRRHLKSIFFVWAIAFFWIQCEENASHCQQKTFSQTWHVQDSLILTVNIPDTSKVYELTLLLEVSPEYPYQNLYLHFTLFHEGRLVSEATPNCILFDPYGEPYGKQHWFSHRIAYRVPLQEHFRFPAPGSYQFLLQPWMRTDSLPHIQKVILCLKEKE